MMELRYEIAEENLRIFVAALHCLAQIGKELSFECEGTSQVTLRALNDAHSASGQVSFGVSFFTQATVVRLSPPSLTPGAETIIPFVKSKVYAKSCCNIFRTLKHVRSVQLSFVVENFDDEHVEDFSTEVDGDSVLEVDVDCIEITWLLRCDFEITKLHRMKVHTCQAMRAVFDKATCQNRLVTRQYHWSSLLAHIHHTNEVAVTCSATHVRFESYFPNTTDGKSHLQTETAVESAEFNEYVLTPSSTDVDSSVQLMFCLKEIRALLAFCKASDLQEVTFYFTSGGSPVLFAAESTSMAAFSIEITLSTVTTFLPASSQNISEEEVPLYAANDSNGNEGRNSPQYQDRYLTHNKRQREE